jgi:L-fuculose-phosphate aldolase
LAESDATLLEELAFGCRILGAEGQGDYIWGHVSLRRPGADHFWLKGSALGLEEITPDDMAQLDMDGKVLGGKRSRHKEWPIHSGVLLARPGVNCVVHTHPMHAIAFAATGEPLRAVGHDGVRFTPPDLPRFTQTTDLITTPALGAAVAGTLSDRDAVFLLNHGIVVAGPDVPTAVINAIFLERACQIQLLAMATGRAYRWTPDDEAPQKRHSLNDPSPSYRTVWEYFRRRLK